ncbi:MAG: diaminopimelate epimerase, partial [Actinobacteria bacterium ATB1]|nr:diaminopimelate epimerase [Actinobacteria bacterium ATB1]
MCGNGVRCFAKFCFDRGILAGTESTIMTRSGPRLVHVHHDAKGKVCRVEVEMGSASFSPGRIPVEADPDRDFLDIRLDGVAQRAYFANVGNPHAVVYVDDPEVTPVDVWGPVVETDGRFPNGANASFVNILDRNRVEARVWERGVGETMACGTAACAIAAVSRRLGHVDSAVDVALPGGDLHVFLGETLILGGPAVEVFTATVDTRSLGT